MIAAQRIQWRSRFNTALRVSMVIVACCVTACSATNSPIIPTSRPTITPTSTATPSATPNANATPTALPTRVVATLPAGVSPTPLLGPSPTSAGDVPTATRVLNPNAPRIEFFTSDVNAVAPGGSITLFWSTRGVDRAVIYQLDRLGERTRLWNVEPDSNLTVATRSSDRGQVDFLISIGEGGAIIEQTLSVALACPVAWFFDPGPEECPTDEAEETQIIEQKFERGRMVYIESENLVYTLFNDGFDPAWIAIANQFNPETDPAQQENFTPPEGFFQPLGIVGFVWRGNDTVRNRLGLGTEPELQFEGYTQTAVLRDGSEGLFISSTNATVLQLLPNGRSWQIITLP